MIFVQIVRSSGHTLNECQEPSVGANNVLVKPFPLARNIRVSQEVHAGKVQRHAQSNDGRRALVRED